MNGIADSAIVRVIHAPAAAVASRKVSSLSLRAHCHHPEGMRSLSPGLRGTSYPGYALSCSANPVRVVSPYRPLRSRCHVGGFTTMKRTADATHSGLVVYSMLDPRVARASQPWANRCNPFGIARNVQTQRACRASARPEGIQFRTFRTPLDGRGALGQRALPQDFFGRHALTLAAAPCGRSL
jgi:hypothetical protein